MASRGSLSQASTEHDDDQRFTVPSWRHLNKKIVDGALYPYLLRLAVLAYRSQPRFRFPENDSEYNSSSGTTEIGTPKRGHSRKGSSGMQDFRRLSPENSENGFSSSPAPSFGNSKLPKEMPKLLQAKFNKIALKPDHKMSDDPLLRRSFLSFYALLLSPDFLRQIKENRRAEDLVMMFLSCVSKELKKNAINDPQESKTIIDKQAAAFVRLLLDIIRDSSLSSSCANLIKQLESYEKSLIENSRITLQPNRNSQYDLSNLNLEAVIPTFDLTDMSLAKDIARLLLVADSEMQRDISSTKTEATEKLAVAELRSIERDLRDYNRHVVYQRIDFATDEDYFEWKNKELESISVQISHYIFGKSLANTTPAAGTSSENYYIPPDPKSYYRHLLKRCLERDYKSAGRELENNPDSVPLLLSKPSINLLNETAHVWRIPFVTRAVLLLDVSQEMFKEGLFDLSNLNDAFNLARHVTTELGKVEWIPDRWPYSDKVQFVTILAGIHDVIIDHIAQILEHIYDNSPPKVGPYMETLDLFIFSDAHTQGFAIIEPSSRQIEKLEAVIIAAAEAKYDSLIDEIPRDHTLDPLHIIDLADKLVGIAKRLQKRYKFALFDKISIGHISAERHLMLFSADSKSMFTHMVNHLQAKHEEPLFEDMMILYKKLAEMRDLFVQVSNDSFGFDIESSFYPFVFKWAESSASLAQSWVDPAIEGDSFSPLNEDQGALHSSSVGDVFTSFRSAITVLNELAWRNEFHKASVLTLLMRGISAATCQYANKLMQLFLEELETEDDQTQQIKTRQDKWLAIARNAVNGKEKINPHRFLKETCVKLNNIEVAQVELDKIESDLDSEKVSRIISDVEKSSKKKPTSFLFTVRIMQAEGLKACDMNGLSDPYVTLVDQQTRKTIGKTRTIYEDLNPYWAEMFEIATTGPKWLTATVWDENALSNHDLCGRAFIRLDPSAFRDFVSQVSNIQPYLICQLRSFFLC